MKREWETMNEEEREKRKDRKGRNKDRKEIGKEGIGKDRRKRIKE